MHAYTRTRHVYIYERRRSNTKTERKNAFKRVRVFEIYDMQIYYNTFRRWVCVNNLKEYIILRKYIILKTQMDIYVYREGERKFVKSFKTTRINKNKNTI